MAKLYRCTVRRGFLRMHTAACGHVSNQTNAAKHYYVIDVADHQEARALAGRMGFKLLRCRDCAP